MKGCTMALPSEYRRLKSDFESAAFHGYAAPPFLRAGFVVFIVDKNLNSIFWIYTAQHVYVVPVRGEPTQPPV